MSEEKREQRKIRLHVYDIELPITIYADEEEIYRRAAKRATNTVAAYTAQANGKKSVIDILYMAIVDLALKYEKESMRNDTKPYLDILEIITSEIEQSLGDDNH